VEGVISAKQIAFNKASMCASAPSVATWQKSFPLWKVTVDGMNSQQAMFQTADNLSFNAFYTAADDWTQTDGRTWGIGKRYGAFCNATEFVTNFLRYPHIDVSMRSFATVAPVKHASTLKLTLEQCQSRNGKKCVQR
jgi:hypothetical protein